MPPKPRLSALLTCLLAACSTVAAPSVTEPLTATVTVPTTTTTTVTLPPTTSTIPLPRSPINGLPVEDQARLNRRVLAIKIDNHCFARPQSGPQAADAVIELPVEGNFTRFIALFHDADSGYVGPIRSGRPADGEILRHLGATFAISGGQPWVLDRIINAGVRMLGEGTGMFRVRRAAPHNLYGNTEALRAEADRRQYSNDPPQQLFQFGKMGDGELASTIQFDWDTNNSVTWSFNGLAYLRTVSQGGGCADQGPHMWADDQGGSGQIAADTLVVLYADEYTAIAPAGATSVPAMDTIGEGRALVFAAGMVAEGNWSRETITDPFRLTHAGRALQVPPGRLWISLLPNGRNLSWE